MSRVVNIDLSVASLSIGLVMVMWGFDKMHIFDKHPRWGKCIGLIYLLVGVFWIFITVLILLI